MDEKLKKIINIFALNDLNHFKLDIATLTINMLRSDNSQDSIIFDELNILTVALIQNELEFTIDGNGTIIVQ